MSKRGKTKSLFLSECVERLRTKRAETFSGASPFLTLYISVAVSCKRLLYNVGKSARPKSSLWVSECDLYIALNARSWSGVR